MLENTFRSQLVKACRAIGLNAMATEVPSSPGFPDMIVIYKDVTLYLELKIHKHMNFWKHFQNTQINWYRNFLKESEMLYAGFYIGRSIFGLTKITNFKLKKLQDYEFNVTMTYTNYKDFANGIKEEIKKKRSCLRKARHSDLYTAKIALKIHYKKHKEDTEENFRIYKCKFCDGYHLGHY